MKIIFVLALLGNKLGRKVIVVIEKFSELHKTIKTISRNEC